MPIYEYQCESCQHQLEEVQKMSDLPLEVCPLCQKPTLKRLLSAPAFHLKGTGWYVTDFKDKKQAPAAKSEEKADSSGTAPTSEPKTETSVKPETDVKKTVSADPVKT